MDDLRIPTAEFVAEVACADGQRFSGKVFVPQSALTHEGPMRAEEWINTSQPFFPFLGEGQHVPFLLNKGQVVVLSVGAEADSGSPVDEGGVTMKRVMLEVAGLSLEGMIAIEMPEGRGRVVDVMNGPEAFLTLRDGERHHLVQKKKITRIIEIREE